MRRRLSGLVLGVFALAANSAPIELRATAPDGVELAGTLHLPDRFESGIVVVITHGSGPDRRDMPGYLRWADAIAGRGVAVLLSDKRGCGDSQGEYVEAPDLSLPAGDLLAWVQLLRARDGVRKVGVLGFSQGGWVGPLAASRSDDIAFVVAISGSGVSPLEQNIFDKTNRCADTGADAAQVASFERAIRLYWHYLLYGDHQQEAQAAWSAVAEEAWFQKAYDGPPMMEREPLLQHPRMRDYVAHSSYDPVPALQELRVPMLAVYGSADRIVPVDASIQVLCAAFADRPEQLTVRIVSGADHGLRIGDQGLAPGYPGSVVDWILGTLAG